MRLIRIIGLSLVLMVLAFSARAELLPVIVRHSGDDAVGKRLALEIKNSIRSSPVFFLVYTEEASIYDIAVVTLDPDDLRNQTRTIYSITLLIKNDDGFDYYLTSMVGLCGQSRLAECASGIVQDLGVQNEDLLEAFATTAVWE